MTSFGVFAFPTFADIERRRASIKLGFEIAQSSVAKYMVKRCGPPSQTWRAFLRNHAPETAAMDLFVVPTIGFDLL